MTLFVRRNAPNIAVMGGVSPPTLTSVDITPTWVQAGETLTATPNATGATSYTYVWTDADTPISGETASTFTNDGTYGSNAINCTVTAHNSAGDSAAVEDTADVTIAWVGEVAVSGTSSTSAQNIDCGTPMNGQSIWMAMTWATTSGNLTLEGSGPTALASHAYYKGTTGAVANRTTLLFALTTQDQTITYQKNSGNYSLQTFFKSVGFSTTPAGLVAAGQAASNQTTSAPTIDVSVDDALFGLSEGYEAVSNPSNVDFLSRANFQEYSTNNYSTAGSGIVDSANASLSATFSTDTNTANKHGVLWKAAKV
jgi:hypothetical protein